MLGFTLGLLTALIVAVMIWAAIPASRRVHRTKTSALAGPGVEPDTQDLHRDRLEAVEDAVRELAGEVRSTTQALVPLSETGLDLSTYFAADEALRDLVPGDLVVYPTDTEGEVIFFGDGAAARSHGEVLGPVPGDLARAAIGVDAVVKAGIAMGEQAGLLVRLTPESTRRLRELQTIKDASGAAMGVLRGTNGTFKHIIRFRPARALQAASSVTGALSAIATQAQLAGIEKAIGAVAEEVGGVRDDLDRDRQAEGLAVRAVILEAYRAAQSTGTLTTAMWDQLAPLYKDVRKLQSRAELEARALARELDGLQGKSVKDRRARLSELEGDELQAVFADLQRDNRALIQYQALRLWHLTVTGDAGLAAYVSELRNEVSVQADLIGQFYEAVESAVEAAGGSKRHESVLSPFDSRRVKDGTVRVLDQLSEMRTSYQPLRMIGERQPPASPPASRDGLASD